MSTSEHEPELPLGNKDDLEDSYNEEEDEDFNPDTLGKHIGSVSSASDNEDDYDLTYFESFYIHDTVFSIFL